MIIPKLFSDYLHTLKDKCAPGLQTVFKLLFVFKTHLRFMSFSLQWGIPHNSYEINHELLWELFLDCTDSYENVPEDYFDTSVIPHYFETWYFHGRSRYNAC